jgi:hypothetical protein
MRPTPLAVIAAALSLAGASPSRADFTPTVQRAPTEPVWQAHLSGFDEGDYDVAADRRL